MRVLYLDCSSGVAGDMLLAALIDAGASEEYVRGSLDALKLPGWELRYEETARAGLRAKRAIVTSADQIDHRPHSDIVALIEDSDLSAEVAARALRIFGALATAEASVHGIEVDAVHFHEVGAIDAIIDVVGVAAAIQDLDPERVVASQVALGSGYVRAAHGELPVPAPAVTELLSGAPVTGEGHGEMATPTGAAILAACVDRFGAIPAMTLLATGYGAGARDNEGAPNVVRALVGEATDLPGTDGDHVILDTNLDDMNPELIPYALERLLSAGAQDAWTSPIVMKKNRPGTALSVLCTREALDAVLDVLYRETTTLGVRIRPTGKHELEREWSSVQIEGHPVRIKIARHQGEVVNVAPEYEDAVKVARITGLPLKEIYRRAVADDHTIDAR